MVSATATDLCSFIDSSPSPFHVVAQAKDRLIDSGFVELDEADRWPTEPGGYVVARSGSLIAWITSAELSPHAGFRVVGAHTDSPNLRLKQHHDVRSPGAGIVALEPYGSPLLDTWLDRDLTIAGRIVTKSGKEILVHLPDPILRVPHLAIHLDRDSAGASPDRQRHLNGLWSLGNQRFMPFLGERIGIDPSDIVGFELMAVDVAASTVFGAQQDLIAAPRLDNQASCYAAVQALRSVEPTTGITPMIVLFDHEEVGSGSERGAQSDFLVTTIERIVGLRSGVREDLFRSLAASVCLSVDMAHATHPNYPEKHEPLHHISMGGGPVLKVHQNLRYATDARGAAIAARACEQAGVPMQRYVHRADLAAGSTIGPLSAARTGILTIDMGAPQLAMHSAREMMAVADVGPYARSMQAFLGPR